MGFQIGQLVGGRYDILGLMPPLAFGELYRAHNRDLGVECALLVLGPALLPDEGARQAVLSRVGLSRGLRHPNLVWLYDVRAEGDQVVIATQWAGVDTLRSRIERRKFERAGWPLPVEEAWGILQQVAYAVLQLHKDAEVLGDLRADTIVVTPEGLKLFNHGVGCALPRRKFIESLERAGEEMFLAPEVRAGQAPTARSDVYSLGAIMHELVFGDAPSVNAPVLGPRSVTRPELAAVLKRALDPEPFERPLSVEALLREIQPTLDEKEQPMPVAAAPPPAQQTVIGEVKLPPAIAAAVERAKAAAAAGLAPSPSEWGGKNEAVTRQLEVDEVESLLGKNETRQIDANEIEALLAKSKDPSLEEKAAAEPKPEAPKPPQLFTAPAGGEPVILLKPEDKKTGEMSPVSDGPRLGTFAGTAPPPLWEDVRSQIQRSEKRKSPMLFIAVATIVTLAVAAVGYLYATGKLAELTGLFGGGSPTETTGSSGGAPTATTAAVTPAPAVAAPSQAAVAPSHAAVPSHAAPAPSVAAAPAVVTPAVAAHASACPAGTAAVDGKKPTCIDVYEYPGEHQVPRVQVSFVEASQLCGARGARLCNEAEWEAACRGPSGGVYPYGDKFVAGKCNAKGGGGKLLPSGSTASCKSVSGAFDMSGNAAEWTVDTQQMPVIKGGSSLAGDPDASCAHKLEAKTLAGGAFVGFRCCRDAAK
jgi:hypothetical protein